MRKKEVKIKVLGLAGSGKSLIVHIIQQALVDCGIHGVSIDDEAPRDRNFMENLIAKHSSEFDVEIETVQIAHKINI